MGQTKSKGAFTILVSDSFERTDEKCVYEPSFRRWLVRQLMEEKMTIPQAVQQFNFDPKSGYQLLLDWRKKYAPEMVLSLASMTPEEKQKTIALEKQVKALEKALEDAKMRTIALNMLIDVAEEKLKINIRKKPGAKQ